jgi:hypothetical protein
MFEEFGRNGDQILSRHELSVLLTEANKMKPEEISETVDTPYENKKEVDGVGRDQFFL